MLTGLILMKVLLPSFALAAILVGGCASPEPMPQFVVFDTVSVNMAGLASAESRTTMDGDVRQINVTLITDHREKIALSFSSNPDQPERKLRSEVTETVPLKIRGAQEASVKFLKVERFTGQSPQAAIQIRYDGGTATGQVTAGEELSEEARKRIAAILQKISLRFDHPPLHG